MINTSVAQSITIVAFSVLFLIFIACSGTTSSTTPNPESDSETTEQPDSQPTKESSTAETTEAQPTSELIEIPAEDPAENLTEDLSIEPEESNKIVDEASTSTSIPTVEPIQTPEPLSDTSSPESLVRLMDPEDTLNDHEAWLNGHVGTPKLENLHGETILIIPFFPFEVSRKYEQDRAVVLLLLHADDFLTDIIVPIHHVIVMNVRAEDDITYVISSKEQIDAYNASEITSQDFIQALKQVKGQMVTQLQ
jgi:hypothetical protein